MLTAYGIETPRPTAPMPASLVATVLTAYGIETGFRPEFILIRGMLQQCLPLTVLKLKKLVNKYVLIMLGCNSAYRLRY